MMRGGVADPTVVGSSLKLRHVYLRYFVVDCTPSKFLIYVARKNISTLCFLIIYIYILAGLPGVARGF